MILMPLFMIGTVTFNQITRQSSSGRRGMSLSSHYLFAKAMSFSSSLTMRTHRSRSQIYEGGRTDEMA